MEINSLNRETILSDAVFDEVFEEPDKIQRQKLIVSLQNQAKLLGVKSSFDSILKAYEKVTKELEKQAQRNANESNLTDFSYFDDGRELSCGYWIADRSGVRAYTPFGEQWACNFPVLITQRMYNVESHKEKVKIAYKIGNRWKEIITDKGVISSSTKIVSLADFGFPVTTESAKNLVKYLSIINDYNIDSIETTVSTSKFGWLEDEFIPYGMIVEFDSDGKFKDLYDAVSEHGDFKTWLELMLKIRKSGRYEPLIYLAASFGSILLKPLNVLPFIVNLWGDTGKGKTVALMVAASVWANPGEGKYITDSVSTQVALEVRENILNNLPIMVDDLSKMRDRYGDAFTDMVYMLCGGKGKDRSNINLSLNELRTWQNICLTNIERPLTGESMRGGAINRILDFEMEDGYMFSQKLGTGTGNKVVEIISDNYGFAGKMFVDIIRDLGFPAIKNMQQEFLSIINEIAKFQGAEKEEKQTGPLSVLLTADKIATDYIFKDGVYLDVNRCVASLKNKEEVSEHRRAYEYILNEVAVNQNKFEPDENLNYKGECWGCIQDGYVVIIKSAFDRMCERGNFSSKGFLRWSMKNNLLDYEVGKPTKHKKFGSANPRCVWLKMVDIDERNNFIDFGQLEIPFE